MIVQATESPFINAIFDREPLDQFVWGRVALLGEAAHPTTPHGLRRFVSLFCTLPCMRPAASSPLLLHPACMKCHSCFSSVPAGLEFAHGESFSDLLSVTAR